MSFVISEMMRLEPFDTMESITERALARASDTGVPQRFEFNRNLFEAQPDKPGYGTVQMIGEVRREASPDEIARLAIGTMSAFLPDQWELDEISRAIINFEASPVVILIAGLSYKWCYDLRQEWLPRFPEESAVVKDTSVYFGNKAVVHFAKYEDIDRIRGMRFDYAFLEERQKEVMGGNYNKFPYRSMDRDRARFEERQERSVRAEARWANFQEIEQDRMAALAVKADEERAAEMVRNSQSRYEMLKPRSADATSQAMEQMAMTAQAKLPAMQQWYEQARPGAVNLSEVVAFTLTESQKLMVEQFAKNPPKMPGAIMWTSSSEDFETTWPSYGGISRSQNPEQEVLRLRGLLQTVDRVLGRHLREQLTAAPSQGSVYASGPGYAVTAFEIRQVVQALDTVSGQPQPIWWGVDPSANSADFTAESEDGEKIVLTKDGDRFDSGVLFDPANRPIRKFKLKELAA